MINPIKKKIVFAILIIGLIGVAILYLVIVPTSNDIKKISIAVYNERLDLEKKYLRGQLLNKTIQDFEEVKNRQDELVNAFMVAGEELEFIQLLENIATQKNVTLDINLSPAEKSKINPGLSVMPLLLNLQGTFNQTMDYLQELENLQVYINIELLEIKTQRQSEQRLEGKVSTTLKGQVYQIKYEEK